MVGTQLKNYLEQNIFPLVHTEDITSADGLNKLVDVLATFITSAEVQQIVAEMNDNKYKIVQVLPASGAAGVMYLIGPDAESNYLRYIWETPFGGSAPEFIPMGSTKIDLEDYVLQSEFDILSADHASLKVEFGALKTSLVRI